MGRLIRRLVLVVAFSCGAWFVPQAHGQTEGRVQQENRPRVSARFVPDSIAIGDRFVLEVEVEKDVTQLIGFPEFEDNTVGEIAEIVAEGEVDTLKRDGRRVTLGKKYILQTFEDGYYSMGRYPMLYGDKNLVDTLWSRDPLMLKVGTFEIDTLTQTIHDIKPVINVPLKAGEISGYIIIGLVVLLLAAVAIWYFHTRRRNLSILGKPKPVEPPHLRAIKELEALHSQKLWQNNKHKLYYTRITDILRAYIEGRYGIRAMEMTSDEIVSAIAAAGVPEKNFGDLKGIIEVADFVKFAKYVPEADVNEGAYLKAYYFVEETKPLQIESQEKPELDYYGNETD